MDQTPQLIADPPVSVKGLAVRIPDVALSGQICGGQDFALCTGNILKEKIPLQSGHGHNQISLPDHPGPELPGLAAARINAPLLQGKKRILRHGLAGDDADPGRLCPKAQFPVAVIEDGFGHGASAGIALTDEKDPADQGRHAGGLGQPVHVGGRFRAKEALGQDQGRAFFIQGPEPVKKMAPCPVQVAAAFVGVGRRKRDILLAFGQAGPDLIPALFTQEKCRAAFHNFQDPEKSFSDLFIFLGQDNPDFCPGSIMPVFHAGGCRTAFFVPPGLFFPADHPDTRLLLDIRSGHPAGAQNSGRVGQQIQNRGFQTDLGRPPVNDIGDAAGKIVQDMPGPGRTGSAGQVGRRGHNGNPRSQKQRTCRRLSRETDGHCFQPPRHQGGKSRMPGHDKGQRAGRKSLVEGLKNRRNVRDDPFQVVCGQKMDNKGF